jgi:rhamnose transport system ATP-binding protein
MASLPVLFPSGWLDATKEGSLAADFVKGLAIKTPSSETLVGALSGGNQQKVALARWLATKPRVLILDEPTQGVDVGAKAEIHGIIRRLAAEGLAVILISSDLPEVLGMSDRIGIMRGGRLVRTLEGASANAHAVMAAALGQDETKAAAA